MTPANSTSSVPAPPVPRSFFEYLRSFGPGLVVVLTWLGAGDVVEASVAGRNYGYALMWMMVLAILMRFLFVSLIAKYQLCNQHGEGVLDGLARLHPAYAPFLAFAAVVMGHVYGSYMTVGVGEVWANMTGIGKTWHWALLWCGIALAIALKPVFRWVEWIFRFLLALLAISFLGTAAWIGPSPTGMVRGIFTLELPRQKGSFDALLVGMGMLGAVGGSLMNLVYPYFLEQKGWRGPRYRRVQFYDFLLGIAVMIILNLSIWTLGAELPAENNLPIENTQDLAAILGTVLGRNGQVLFYLGIFSAIFTSQVGHALGLGYLTSHALLRWRSGPGLVLREDYRRHPAYRWVVAWCLLSPLVWVIPGMPGFVKLTLVANSAQVVLIPFLAGGMWCITAFSRFIGPEYRNRWWENAVMALLFALAIWGAIGSVRSVVKAIVGS